MTRRNKPRLIDPALDVQGHELRQLGVPSTGDLHRATHRLQRAGMPQPRKAPVVNGGQRDGTGFAALLDVLAGQGTIRDQTTPELAGLRALAYALPDVLIQSAVDDGPLSLTTTLATLKSVTVGPLTTGVSYLLVCLVHSRLSIDSTGFARIYARTQAGSSSVAGERAGTIDGERSCMAVAFETVTGAGASVTMSARGQMTTSTGAANSVLVLGLAFPLSLAVS